MFRDVFYCRLIFLQVRAHFTKCSRHRRNGATCNSAVAIRSGDDVITLKGAGGIFPSSRDHGHHGMFSRLFHHHRSHRRSVAAITVEMYKNGELTPGTTIRRIGCGQKYEVSQLYMVFKCLTQL